MRKLIYSGTFFLLSLNILIAQETGIQTVIQTGHYSVIKDVDYSYDGNYIITASEDKTIKLWRARDGKEIRAFIGSESAIAMAVMNRSNLLIMGVNVSGEILIWDVNTGILKKKYTSDHIKYTCADFHPSENIIACGVRKSHIITLNIETGDTINVFRAIPVKLHNSANFEYENTKTVYFSSDGKYLIAGKEDFTTIVWETKSGKEIKKYKNHRGTCSGCANEAVISADNNMIISAYSDSLKIVNFKTGKLIRQISERSGTLASLDISANNYVAVEQYDKILIWNLKTGKLVNTIYEKSKNITSISFNPDGTRIVAGNESRMADVWDVKTGKLLFSLKGYLNNIDERILSHSYMYWAALINETKLSPDGKYIAVGRAGNNARIIDFKTGRQIKTLKGHTRMVICLTFSKDGKYLATAGIDGKAIVWDTKTFEPVQRFQFRDSTLAIFSIDISPDNKLLATADWAGRVVIWDITTGEYINSSKPHDGYASYKIKFSPNGLYILSAGLDRKLKLIELDTGEEIMTYIGHTNIVSSINIHPTKEMFITASQDNTIRVWDFYSGLQTMKINAHNRGVYAAKFDEKGQYILSGGNDNLAKVWDAKTGTLIKEFKGHVGAVGDVNISPDYKYLVSGSRDGSIRIWDFEKTKELISLTFFNDEDWFIKNENGYFDASQNAFKEISFVKDKELYAIERFFDGFYTPGIYQKAVFEHDDLLNNNLFRQINQSPPPSIEIIAPEAGINDNNLASFLIKVTNNGGGIHELRVMHNGKRLDIDDKELANLRKKGQYVMKSFDVMLVPGENNFNISALSDGLIESEDVSLSLVYKGTPKNTNCYVVCIGINQYENSALNLNYARSDAKAFADMMKSKGKKLFKDIRMYEIYDSDATKENIFNSLNEIAGVIQKEDVLIFFYAGHGSMVDNYFYFMTSRSKGLYQKDKLTDAIHVKDLQEKLKSIQALKQVVFIDACQSGTSIDLLAMRGVSEEKALAQLSRSSGIHVLASSESQQQAAEIKSLGHGVFTHVLLEALNGKADGAPKDSKVTIYEIKSFIDDQVPEISYKLIQHKQFPSTFSIGHDFPLVME